MKKKLVKALKKIISASIVDATGYDVEILDFDEVSFEKGSPQTRYEPEVPSERTLKINSVFIAGMSNADIKKGDKIKLDFSFKENGLEYYVENEVKQIEKTSPVEDGIEVFLKDLYVVYVGEPMTSWAV
jgi:hypothetical protein